MPNSNDLLTRRQTAQHLSELGFAIQPATLARKAVVGGGPTFRKFGRTPLYKWSDVLAWAEARLSPPVHSTSEIAKSQ